MKFNDIANAISIISGVTLAGIVGVGVYTYVNKDAIIEGIKSQAIEAVTGSLGGGLGGGLPTGSTDLKLPTDAAAAPPAAPFALPN
tara:strand:+ start:462 stop:719 length:258 start_codon:yes stop_codon:yes gene_type:complete